MATRAPLKTVRLGDVIRRFRGARGLSLRAVAAKAGFTPSFLSQVEHGQASPSITSLEKLAAALDVALGEFFADTERPTAIITRSAERPSLDSRWSRATLEALSPSGPGRILDPVMITLEPGGSSGKKPAAHQLDQFAMVFEGRVGLTLDTEEHRLQRGDAVSIRAGAPHRWENRSGSLAQILIVFAYRSR